MSLTVRAPVARVGQFRQYGHEINAELQPDETYEITIPGSALASVDELAIRPLTIEHDEQAIVGCARGFHVQGDKLTALLTVWRSDIVQRIKAGERFQLSIGFVAQYDGLVATELFITDVAIVVEGEAGGMCSLPLYTPRTSPVIATLGGP